MKDSCINTNSIFFKHLTYVTFMFVSATMGFVTGGAKYR